jgi:hypothetical protein
MAIQFKEFIRPAFSGNPEGLKKKVIQFCNTELKCFRIISISEAKGITDDFYRITVWYDDEGEKFEHLMSSAVEAQAALQATGEQTSPPDEPPES